MIPQNPKDDSQRCLEVVLSAKLWLFAEILNVGLPVERPDAVIRGASSWESLQEARRNWLGAEQQVRKQVNRLASARIASRQSEEIPLGLHYWYWIRLRSAQKLARMIVAYDHSRTVFGVPSSVTKAKMLRWLLVSWWADGGI